MTCTTVVYCDVSMLFHVSMIFSLLHIWLGFDSVLLRNNMNETLTWWSILLTWIHIVTSSLSGPILPLVFTLHNLKTSDFSYWLSSTWLYHKPPVSSLKAVFMAFWDKVCKNRSPQTSPRSWTDVAICYLSLSWLKMWESCVVIWQYNFIMLQKLSELKH